MVFYCPIITLETSIASEVVRHLFPSIREIPSSKDAPKRAFYLNLGIALTP